MTSRISVLGAIRFDFILMLTLAVFMVFSLSSMYYKYRSSDIWKKLIIFICYLILTIPLVKWPGSVIKSGLEYYLKVIFFFFFTLSFVNTEKRFKVMILVFLGCQIFRGFEPAWLHINTGYWGDFAYSGGGVNRLDRLSGAPHDIVNPNQLAWVIVNIIPFLFYLGWQYRSLMWKLLTSALGIGLLYPLFLTGSRSGMVCLFVVLFAIVFFSKKRKRNLVILLCLFIPAFIIISGLLSSDMRERYRSLFDKSAVGADTAQGRIKGIQNTLSTIINLHGVFGHGLGTSRELNANFLGTTQATHNLYIEILQEVGVIGAFIFCSYIYAIFKVLYDTVKRNQISQNNSFCLRVVKSLLVWETMHLIYSLSCFGLASWEWYFFGGVTAVAIFFKEAEESAPTKMIKEPGKAYGK